jgi:hypothetical protein
VAITSQQENIYQGAEKQFSYKNLQDTKMLTSLFPEATEMLFSGFS